jgi:signal transduction histidine kinase
MRIFPSIIFFPGQEAIFENGIIVSLPAELTTIHCVNSYKKIAGKGWGQTEYGYQYYSFDVHGYARIIFVGLYLRDAAVPSKKFYGYSAIYSKRDIESIASQVVEFQFKCINSIRESTGSLIHDIRSLSRDIYHAAKEGEYLIDRGNNREAKVRFGNISALQQMLKMRVDAFDYVDSDLPLDELKEKIVYPLVDKVCRSFKPRASERSIQISLAGQSHGTSLAPEHLILVPYVIIENAIKYAPDNSEVSVFVYETDAEIITTVESFGPRLTKVDAEHIFERGFRGSNARQKYVQGNGIGLFLAKKIIDSIGGEIKFEQESIDSSMYSGYCKTFVRFFIKKYSIDRY